jgi:5-methylcytosine-specific restriction enzyme A
MEQSSWRDWYGLQRWKRRARHQLKTEPLCAACLVKGKIMPASIADHVEPHRGNWNAFRLGRLQSLCTDCHSRKWADDKRGFRCDIDADGLPIDPNHPFNRA